MLFGGRTGSKFAGKLVVFGAKMRFKAFPVETTGQVFDLHQKNLVGDWPCARS